MSKPTYNEQEYKMHVAYLQCKVNPFSACECYVGNLLNGASKWIGVRASCSVGNLANPMEPGYKDGLESIVDNSDGLYTPEEIVNLEKKFMDVFYKHGIHGPNKLQTHEKAEDIMFEAFNETNALLKEIHISKGEVIEEPYEFRKRVNYATV